MPSREDAKVGKESQLRPADAKQFRTKFDMNQITSLRFFATLRLCVEKENIR
jgi:hypothetical protein